MNHLILLKRFQYSGTPLVEQIRVPDGVVNIQTVPLVVKLGGFAQMAEASIAHVDRMVAVGSEYNPVQVECRIAPVVLVLVVVVVAVVGFAAARDIAGSQVVLAAHREQ